MVIRENKLFYYAKGYLRKMMHGRFFRPSIENKLSRLDRFNRTILEHRVNYYNKLEHITSLGNEASRLDSLRNFERLKTYHIDAYEYARYFNQDYRAHFLFGDITYTNPFPTIQKSRPAAGDNHNAVLLKLNRIRHYVFVRDRKRFLDKKNMLIGRTNVKQPGRIRFMEMYFDHPMCNLGQINTDHGNLAWLKPKISRTAHLDYKFILCLEGHDVATNLKWVMSSNSLAVMPKPRYETWFMEGRLQGNHHYVEIKDDYSNLEERMRYYIDHPDEAQQIISNANQYVKQFRDQEQEEIISLLVLQKYFYYTGQTDQYALL